MYKLHLNTLFLNRVVNKCTILRLLCIIVHFLNTNYIINKIALNNSYNIVVLTKINIYYIYNDIIIFV